MAKRYGKDGRRERVLARLRRDHPDPSAEGTAAVKIIFNQISTLESRLAGIPGCVVLTHVHKEWSEAARRAADKVAASTRASKKGARLSPEEKLDKQVNTAQTMAALHPGSQRVKKGPKLVRPGSRHLQRRLTDRAINDVLTDS